MHPLLEYHQRTKHTYESVRSGGHFLDWDNEPSKFKRYEGVDRLPLPEFRRSGMACHDSVSASARGEGGEPLDVERLSHLLFHAAGVVRSIRGSYGSLSFRTYASAGALYPNEVYVVAGDVRGLDPGVYHYDPEHHGLMLLREGDLRGNLGLAGEAPGAASVVLTGIPWRTSWKYQARGFRHLYWDAGMMVANLLAAGAARGLRARVLLGFVDEAADHLVGVDGRTEFALCAVSVGAGEAPEAAELPPLDLQVNPLSRRPERDPLIERARAGVALGAEAEVAALRRGSPPPPEEPRGERLPIEPLDPSGLSADDLEDVIRRRGSTRRLAPEPLPAPEEVAIAERALAPVPGDVRWPAVRAFLVANALEGIDPGAYEQTAGGDLALLRKGGFRREAGYLCLEQRLGADAAAVAFLTADATGAVEALGGRGYAAAQLGAAIVAGRLYLGGYAQCLGVSGITFYDDEIREFFGTPNETMLTVVLGREGQRASIRRCRQALETA